MLNGIVQQNLRAISPPSFCVTFPFIPSLQRPKEGKEDRRERNRLGKKCARNNLQKKKSVRENVTGTELPINLMVAVKPSIRL